MIIKTKLKTKAKQLAKANSQHKEYTDVSIYIIYCNRTEMYYVDTDGLIRLWERLEGYYINGIFTKKY